MRIKKIKKRGKKYTCRLFYAMNIDEYLEKKKGYLFKITLFCLLAGQYSI